MKSCNFIGLEFQKMTKRLLDLTISSITLLLFSPIISIMLILIWLQDFNNPLYIAQRVGKNGKLFKMFKLRSMVVNAEASGVDSTGNNDSRITSVGKFIRKSKLDEISQLINVLIGNMSLVGPRPNVKRETDLYSEDERIILEAKPGITDLASIVFADEGDILADKSNPDIAYNQLIRPYKSQLAIVYVKNRNIRLDLQILSLTVVNFVIRKRALSEVSSIVRKISGDNDLAEVCLRQKPLVPKAPPGFNSIIESRDF